MTYVTRRSILASLVAGAGGLAIAPGRLLAQPTALTLCEGLGPGSVTHIGLSLVQPILARELARPVNVDSVPGLAAAAGRVLSGGPGFALGQVVGGVSSGRSEAVRKLVAALESMPPLARIVGPYSTALAVAVDSPVRTWADLVAKQTPRIAGWGLSVGGPALEMLTVLLGRPVQTVEVSSRADNLAALRDGRADAILIHTNSILPGSADGRLARPIMTFGGARSPHFPSVPTVRETSGKHFMAYTYTVALLASPQMPEAERRRITTVLVDAGEDEELRAQGEKLGITVQLVGPETVMAGVRRMEKVMRELEAARPR